MLREADALNHSQLVALAYASGTLDAQAGWPHSPMGRRCLVRTNRTDTMAATAPGAS
jgi:hypothetical protein